MAQHKNSKSVNIILLLIFSAFTFGLGIDLLKTPRRQESLPSLEIYSYATTGNPRNEQIVLEPTAGTNYRIYCANAEKLCEYAKNTPNKRFAVRLAKISVFGDYWPISATVDKKIIISETEQATKYKRMRHGVTWRFLICMATTAISAYFYFTPKPRETI